MKFSPRLYLSRSDFIGFEPFFDLHGALERLLDRDCFQTDDLDELGLNDLTPNRVEARS